MRRRGAGRCRPTAWRRRPGRPGLQRGRRRLGQVSGLLGGEGGPGAADDLFVLARPARRVRASRPPARVVGLAVPLTSTQPVRGSLGTRGVSTLAASWAVLVPSGARRRVFRAMPDGGIRRRPRGGGVAGEANAESYNSELQVEGLGSAWALPGLELLMDEPQRKADVWKAMRRLMARWKPIDE